MKLQKLEIKSFRGATKPFVMELDHQKPITMIFGENGNGKSSIADALICLCTESIGSLEDKSSTEKCFLRSLDSSPDDVEISLTASTGLFSAKYNATGTKLVKTPPAGIPSLRQLRRRQITRLIDAAPSDRFKELQDYIDVSSISKCEDTLRSLEKTTDSTLNKFRALKEESAMRLSEFWNKEGKPHVSWLEWAKQETSDDIGVKKVQLQSLNSCIGLWNSTTSNIHSYRQAFTTLANARRTLETARNLLDNFQQGNPAQDVNLLKLLTEAKQYIAPKDKVDNCPVCNQGTERTGLLTVLDQQIDAMQQLQKLNQDFKNAKTGFDQSNHAFEQISASCYAAITNFCRINLECVQSLFQEHTELLNSFLVLTQQQEQQAFLKKRLSDFDALFSKVRAEQEKVNAIVQRHNGITTQFESFKKSDAEATRLSKKIEVARAALEIVENKRKSFVNDELASISGVVQTLYSKIHPGEPIGQIAVALDPSFKQSIDILGNFHALTNIAPQSLYSESHLDTLGLCIFFALAKKYREPDTILVLDDVMMSVDHNHLERFIDVLHEDLTEFTHIFITTHYRPWREMYRHGRAPSGKIQFVELLPWTIEKGIRYQNGKVNLEELRYHLQDEHFDRQKLCSLSGIILENIFDFLAVKYQCKMPRKAKAEYVLRELTDCLDSKLQKALKLQVLSIDENGDLSEAGMVETDLQPIIHKLKQLAIVRNWVGAHFNVDAANISDVEVKEFAEITLQLGELITCPVEGSFPVKANTGEYHATRSGRIRMFPFAQPQ